MGKNDILISTWIPVESQETKKDEIIIVVEARKVVPSIMIRVEAQRVVPHILDWKSIL